ncbi:LysM peptidoglycan-binding domain-containing protein [Myxococcota bacterium]|nr:LysM peptidoglycan-binding domain-containing protein [Myxococcota bacterium]MBU1379505.1 LysM peptidoglycan-binding domain-containing protein [Myxococcota bacterium]MBU1495730.1 LysM peptidoglycan-binding domain-containing protein [Myxococcota bacterium]
MTITFLLLIGSITLGQTTVPGTYPPVPTKYWVPVNSPTPKDTSSGNEGNAPTTRRVVLTENTSKNKEVNSMDTISDSGVVKWVGNKQYHQVIKGETLWDLAVKYFGDAWYWPRLWSWNPHITNPHWLFPGTIVYLTANGKKVIVKQDQKEPENSFSGLTWDKDAVTVRKQAMVEEEEIKDAHTVSGSPEEKTLLSSGDTVYIKLSDKTPAIGETMSLFRRDKVIKDPKSKEKLGQVVRILGELVIREIRPKKYAIGRITKVLDPIKRGDLVFPVQTRFNTVKSTPAPVKKKITGKIVYAMQEREMLSSGSIVIINIGKNQKVQNGHRIKVLTQGDGLYTNLHPLDPDYKIDETFPIESKGEIVVFKVSEKYSLGIINKMRGPIRLGDTVVFGDYPDRDKDPDAKKTKKDADIEK